MKSGGNRLSPTNDEDPYEGFIQDHGFASSTPVTDGEHIFVFYGKTGVAAYDLAGEQKWLINVGTASDPYKWGPDGPSPVLFGDLVIVNAGIVGNKVVALNKADGTEAWSIADETFTNSWSTPIPVQIDDHVELVFNMPGRIFAVNPEGGDILWKADSPITETACASLAQHDGVVFAMGGRGGQAIAIRCGGSGDVTATHTAWAKPLRAGIGTPIVADGRMYWNSRGVAYCADCETGELVYEDRLPAPAAAADAGERRMPAGSYGSAVIAGGNVYMPMRSGTVHVVKPGDSLELVATNDFGEEDGRFSGTPAISDGRMFIRSDKKLYCVGE